MHVRFEHPLFPSPLSRRGEKGIVKIKKYKVGWRVKPSFHIKLHRKDKPVLDKICKLLKVGRIYEKGPSAVEFNVISIKEL